MTEFWITFIEMFFSGDLIMDKAVLIEQATSYYLNQCWFIDKLYLRHRASTFSF